MMLNRIPSSLWLMLVVCSCALAYYPGLYGDFLLDDFSSLAGLSDITPENFQDSVLSYTLNGVASTLGRPLSLLSFVPQWESWPSNPFPFKLVNLLLHLANGILIYLLTRQLLTIALVSQRQLQFLSLAITALWLLHPLQISTVLYVVQRMTELSALFTLAGLLIYLHGRVNMPATNVRGQYLYMTLGMGVGLVLGILSKENAILLCLYILVLEATVLVPVPRPRYWRYWAGSFLVVPLIALTLYLLPDVIEYALKDYPNRSFSSLERLFIQSHVLLDYLQNILLPRLTKFGLFHTDYNVVLFSVDTVLKSGLLLVLLFSAWRLRTRFALFSMGILWFFAGHVLESTALNLELYFEHRNYLSLWGILIALVTSFTPLLDKIRQYQTLRIRGALLVGAGLWSALICIITLNEVHLWANPALQAAVWAKSLPQSNRAQGHYAYTLTQQGKLNEAVTVYKKGAETLPNEISMLLNWQELQCISTEIELPPEQELLARMATGDYTLAPFTILNEIIGLKQQGRCQAMDDALIEAMLQNLQVNPHYQTPKSQRNIHIFFINYYFYLEAYEQATTHITEATRLYNSPDLLLLSADIQLQKDSKEDYIVAVANLDHYCASHKAKCLPYKKRVTAHIEFALSRLNSPQ